MGTIKERLKGNRTAKVLSLLAALVMPLYWLILFVVILATGDYDTTINHYYLTCFGFYGCIFLCLSWERKWLWLKIVLIAVNAIINGFLIFMAIMGGASGPLIALLQMIIPFIPWPHMFG